jgi:hypothetical protein
MFNISPAKNFFQKDKLFLHKDNAEENLKLLADFNPSLASNTWCTTQEVYNKVPYLNPSKETIREWTVYSALSMTLSVPLMASITGFTSCVIAKYSAGINDNIGEICSDCFSQIARTYESSALRLMAYLFASGVGLMSIGCYVGARYCFRDSFQASRFKALDVEYARVAEFLLKQFEKANEDREADTLKALQKTALKLKANKKLIRTALQNVVYLTPLQANLLTIKLEYAAKYILNSSH